MGSFGAFVWVNDAIFRDRNHKKKGNPGDKSKRTSWVPRENNKSIGDNLKSADVSREKGK